MFQTGEGASLGTEAMPLHRSLGLTDEAMLGLYAKMTLTRALDDRLWALNRQGKAPLVASCQGVEAASLGVGLAAKEDGDCFLFPYYRDMALKLVFGITPMELVIGHLGKEGDSFNGGRQFLLQGASTDRPMIQTSNVVGSNLCQSVGYAIGCKILGEKTVTLVSFGDGGSSQGECHEAMNFAGVHKAPVVFVCYNNRLAISVPQEKQMAIKDLADRAAGYGFPGRVVDGTDLLEVYQNVKAAIERAREESGGPTFLEMKVERLRPHTSDDDDTRYRSAEDLEASKGRDPLVKLRSYLTNIGVLTTSQEERIRGEAREEVNRATEEAEKAEPPDPSTLMRHVYSP